MMLEQDAGSVFEEYWRYYSTGIAVYLVILKEGVGSLTGAKEYFPSLNALFSEI